MSLIGTWFASEIRGEVRPPKMTGKVLTSWSLVWLLATFLFVVGGALNLSQRASHNLPPTDGVVWQLKNDGGIYAEKVLPGLAASRAGISTGDKLLGISLDSDKTDEITSPADVQMYLEAAGVDGSLTYFYQRPSYSFANNFYYADLKHIDTLPRWTAGHYFSDSGRYCLARCRDFRAFQTRRTRAVCAAFCDYLFGGVRFSRL